jgi:ketosteroid isomerase-like protein
MTNTISIDADRKTLLSSIENLARAICAQDIEGIMRDYAKDAVLYDIKPPFQTKGSTDWRTMWEYCLPMMPNNMTIERHDFSLRIDGDLAAAHWIQKMTGMEQVLPGGEMWMRITVIYQRIHGDQKSAWKIVHDHASMPFNPQTGMVLMTK